MRISDWSSDVCSSDLLAQEPGIPDEDMVIGRAVERQANPARRGGLAEHAQAAVDEPDEIDRVLLERQLVRLRLREVQDGFADAEQMRSAVVDVVDVLIVFRRKDRKSVV